MFDYDKYAPYVFWSYGIAAVVLTGVIVWTFLRVRAIEPRRGFWTLPAGYMEEGESLEQAVCREAQEEAMADLRLDGVLGLYSIPRISQVQVMYRAELLNEPSPGPESLEVAMFAWQDIPWTELAFPSVRWALEDYDRTKTLRVFPPAIRTAQS